MSIIDVVIPAFNEEESLGLVLKDIPSSLVRNVIVVNNNSTDNTAEVAKREGAIVLNETRQGYGSACLKGINFIEQRGNHPDILIFIDADYSDYPEEMFDLIKPIHDNNVDLVIGSRTQGLREKGAMMPQQVFGNWLATTMIKWLYGVKFSDLGPFRAIKWNSLMEIQMCDPDFGWTVEMQVKAAKNNLTFAEVPVNYRKRIGVSKITGTLKGTVLAGYKIITTILKYK
ncbi:MAG: glycosyltransferase family 2 protein [Bacteroidota bacterium]